jgi:hypothetical protein
LAGVLDGDTTDKASLVAEVAKGDRDSGGHHYQLQGQPWRTRQVGKRKRRVSFRREHSDVVDLDQGDQWVSIVYLTPKFSCGRIQQKPSEARPPQIARHLQ